MDSFLLGLSSVLLSSLILVIFLFSRPKKLNLPPGPPGYPVVGNLLQVAGSGIPFFQYVRDHLIPRYGPILTLRMGTRTMIVVSGAHLAREALIDKGQVFASRPRENPTRAIFSCNKFTVNAALYGPVWRSLRRNMVHNMLAPARLRGFRALRTAAMDKLVARLRHDAALGGGAVAVLKNARFAVFCILLGMCFGVEMDEKTIDRVDQMMKSVLMVLDPRLDDYLPSLALFFPKQWKKVQSVRHQQIQTLVPLIEKRREAIRNSNDQTFSYLDTLFDLEIEGRKSGPTDPEIVTLCSEFLNGGTDTTATAVEWAIARMIENPAIQNRVASEIRLVVGEKKVEEGDLEKMPYLNAFVKELLRRHPPTYFSLTHAVTEPTTLGGYDIPTDANVEFFLPGISDDPTLWSDPERFDPERFLSGREEADMTGITGVKMIPFGIGRRICPGLSMATLHVSLMLARMVQEFEWSSVEEGGKVDFAEKVEFTVVMKNSLTAKITPRA
ncbi:cytochrome P450 [Striga asiatica]|uniref:Cytochrome P450 n=1 Tax=Striga asiatica TaxID=4170 RepID=A0A5A7P858_STRAF|nr:cytochrome P450 [Striga asiatica]